MRLHRAAKGMLFRARFETHEQREGCGSRGVSAVQVISTTSVQLARVNNLKKVRRSYHSAIKM
jgi:hypothetical protein